MVDIDIEVACVREGSLCRVRSRRVSHPYSPSSLRRSGLDKSVRLLGLGSGVRTFGASMVYPYLALYLKNAVGLGYAEIGVLILLVSILPLAVSPFGGLIADRAGRKKVLLLSLAGEAASVFLIAESMREGSIAGVLLGGALAGVASATGGPAISAYVADVTQLTERSMGFTWVRIGFNGGFTVGVALGGAMIGLVGFPETGFLAAAVITAGVVFLTATLSPSPYDVALGQKAQGVVIDGATRRAGSIRESALILARDRTFLVLCVASLFSGVVYGNWSTTFPLFSNTVLMVPYSILGIALALNGAIVFFGQAPTTRLLTGRRHTSAAIYSVALYGVSFLALGAISYVPVFAILAVFTFVVVLTIGENVGALAWMTLPSNVSPVTEVGAYNGVFILFNGVGSSVSPAIGGFVLAWFANPVLVWGVLAIPVIPAVLLYEWVGRKIPKSANTV